MHEMYSATTSVLDIKAFTNMDVTRSTDGAPSCSDKVVPRLAGNTHTNSKRNFGEAIEDNIAGEKFANEL